MEKTAQEIFEELVSKDPSRIWEICGYITDLNDEKILRELAEKKDEIRMATSDVDLGGMLAPNSRFLFFAFRKMEFCRSGTACICNLYPEHEGFDPEKHEKLGNVRISSRPDPNVANKELLYVCECTKCGQKYLADEREYHSRWWKWSKIS